MTLPTSAKLIGLDWGTTHCRAYLLGSKGDVLSERLSTSGSRAVAARASAAHTRVELMFEKVFSELCGDWLAEVPGIPVIACGMVGSNHGWAESVYRSLPADLSATRPTLTTVRTTSGIVVRIIPGLISDVGLPEVMRGEESQVLGALVGVDGSRGRATSEAQIVLLPGTHSKWVRVIGTTVTAFETCMTGEIYSLLANHSTLSLLAIHSAKPDWTAFERGLDVATSEAGKGGILRTAFSARTMVITGSLAPNQVEDYLSGLLIGQELAGVGESWLTNYAGDVLLCGSAQLTERYRRALERRGVATRLALPRSAAAGMWSIAGSADLIQEPSA